jgi:hypothetical protein
MFLFKLVLHYYFEFCCVLKVGPIELKESRGFCVFQSEEVSKPPSIIVTSVEHVTSHKTS